MKLIYLLVFVIVSIYSFSQNKSTNRYTEVRIMNKGKFHVLGSRITINDSTYLLSNEVYKKKSSEYIKVPYIWNRNNSLMISIRIKKNKERTIMLKPFDHIGDKKIENGSYSFVIKTRLIKGEVNLTTELIKEK